jgi:hypothetical protein
MPPSVVTPQVFQKWASIAMKAWPPVTAAGEVRLVVVPLPSSPFEFVPQQ